MGSTQRALAFATTLFLASAGSVVAQEAASKIGFVEVERAVFVCDEGKARLKELETWAKPRQEELTKLGKEINDLGAEINAKRGVTSDEALAEMNRQLVARQRDAEDKQRVAKREFEKRQDQVLKDLGSKLQEIVGTYARENGYTAIFILKPNDLVFLAPGADITDTVIKLYSQKYPFPGAAAGK
jgi:outer membrane protein